MRIAAIFALALVTTSAAAQDMPARKAGLWELTMTFEGRSMPPQVMQHCTDAATDKAMQEMGGNMRSDMCSKRDIKQVGGTIVMDSVCNMGGATTTSHGVVTGDFNSAYTIRISSKREGGPAAPGMPAETQMSIEAKWTGPCKTDQKPGDIIMANGMKMNVTDMQKGGPPGMRK